MEQMRVRGAKLRNRGRTGEDGAGSLKARIQNRNPAAKGAEQGASGQKVCTGKLEAGTRSSLSHREQQNSAKASDLTCGPPCFP